MNKDPYTLKTSCFIVFFTFVLMACEKPSPSDLRNLNGMSHYRENYSLWSDYLGGPDRNHFTALSQITPENINEIKVAWEYSTPDSGQMQMNAIIIDTILYGISAGLKVFALHAATGQEIWSTGDHEKVWHSTSRGVAYWTDGTDKRIFYTAGSYLFAIDALTGQTIRSFGDDGKVDLHKGLPPIAQNKFIVSNTPGTVYKNLIVMPLRLSEGPDAAPGDIRAYDVKSGDVVWTFHTIPYPGEEGYDTWEDGDAYKNIITGAANNWAGMAADIKAGILYVPTGSAAPDFYGADRKGSNLYSDCLLALNADTGEKLWHYQFTHHDIWDRDPPAPPNLIEVQRHGKKIKAVAQVTKQGYVFVFDRYTGEPLFEIEERPVPPSKLDGESAWHTQPVPKLPLPFARQSYEMNIKDISIHAPDREKLQALWERSSKDWYAPPDTSPVFLLPGYDGGAEWGGAAADPSKGILYVNSNEMAWILQMEDVRLKGNKNPSEVLYLTHCASCHQKDFSGIPESGYPSIKDVNLRMNPSEIASVITRGKGRMAGLPFLTSEQINQITDFISGKENKEKSSDIVDGAHYRHLGYKKFLDSNGLPGISPPWGTLNAIDLNSGAYLWKVPLGNVESVNHSDSTHTGVESYGGPIVSSNGLIIQAGTKDGYIRAFSSSNGKLLWEDRLPAPAFATPSTYEVDGKQFIVVACGGEKLGTPKGNKIRAYALE